MNKKLLVSFALASLTGISTQAKEKMSSETTQQRPNIILFMVDDMGWQDTSLPFWTQKTHYNEAYETPNMERLAKKGMMFTQAYACNISSATRCSLITGANNTRHRVTNWTLEKNKATDRPSNTIQLPDWNYNGVSQVTGTSNTFVGTSFVELLRQNGYHTIHCGKAHFGSIDTPGENPTHWGFEVRAHPRWKALFTNGHPRLGRLLGNRYICYRSPDTRSYQSIGQSKKIQSTFLSIYGTLCHPHSC